MSRSRRRGSRAAGARGGRGSGRKEAAAGGAPAPASGPIKSTDIPPFALSLARGFQAVGSAPVPLATALLALLVTWAAFVVLGVDAGPRLLAVAMAISPAHLFTDVPVAFGASGSAGVAIAVVAALALLRAAPFGLLILMIRERLEGRPADLRQAGRRLPRAVVGFATVYAVDVGIVVVLLQIVTAFLGPLSLLAVIAAIHFLAFVPVVAVVEETRTLEAFRRGVRLARLGGSRHLVFSIVYFLLIFYAASVSPFGPVAPATPDAVTWGFGMLATLLHAGFLGALVFRWLAVREALPPAREGTALRRRRSGC